MTLKVLTNDIGDADDAISQMLDTRVTPHVRIINGTLDEDPTSPSAVVVHGRIDPSTLRFLKVDNTYQRPLGNRPDIYEALRAGVVVPSIEIGVRSQDFECDGQDIIIRSKNPKDQCPAYIIDGWQRVGTALQLLEHIPTHNVRMFASIHFGTDAVWERHRFTELNKNIRKVSPNLHLRNMRDTNDAILTLYGLSKNTKAFPLYKRVTWSQNVLRGELVTARELAKVSWRIHSHLGAARNASTEEIARALLTIAKGISLDQFRRNVTTLFHTIDECWGIGSIEHRHSAIHIKSGFLQQLARMLSAHVDFWDDKGHTLFIGADLRRKLAKFPVTDPSVRNLAGSGGAAGNILYELLVSHMNSGKRTGQLRSRYVRTA